MGPEAHFGLRRQSTATTALSHSDVILWCIERQMIANAREAEQKKSGVALRFPPHSKNAALSAVATDSRLSRVIGRRLLSLALNMSSIVGPCLPPRGALIHRALALLQIKSFA